MKSDRPKRGRGVLARQRVDQMRSREPPVVETRFEQLRQREVALRADDRAIRIWPREAPITPVLPPPAPSPRPSCAGQGENEAAIAIPTPNGARHKISGTLPGWPPVARPAWLGMSPAADHSGYQLTR